MIEFDALLARLAKADVSFLVVGGYAVMKAGFLRVTEDIDVLLESSPGNIERFAQALEMFSPAAAELTPDDFPMEEGSIRIVEDFDIDVFVQMSGKTYSDLRPESDSHDVLGESVLFLGREALIALKDGSLREKDQIDVAWLRRHS